MGSSKLVNQFIFKGVEIIGHKSLSHTTTRLYESHELNNIATDLHRGIICENPSNKYNSDRTFEVYCHTMSTLKKQQIS